MNPTLSPVLQGMAPYAYANAKLAHRLDVNESFVPLPEGVRARIAARVAALDFCLYPDPGCTALKEQVAAFYGLRPENLSMANGSDELISVVIGRLLAPGASVLFPEGDFDGYAWSSRLFGHPAFPVPRDEDYLCPAPALVAAIRRHQPDLVIFSNPNNPRGNLLPREQVEQVIAASPNLVAVDEAYMDLCPEQSVLPLVDQYPNLLVLKTFSKGFGMAGIRLGFAAAGAALCRAVESARDPYNVNAMTQAAALCLLEEPGHLARTAQAMRQSISLLQQGFEELAGSCPRILRVYPSVTNFLLIRMEGADRFVAAMREHGFALRLFSPQLLRISAGSPEVMRQLLQQAKALLLP